MDTQSRAHKPLSREKTLLGTTSERKWRSEHPVTIEAVTVRRHDGDVCQATRPRATRLLKQARVHAIRHPDESSLTPRVSDLPVRSGRGSIELDAVHAIQVCVAVLREKHCSCTDPSTHRSHRWTLYSLPPQLRVLLQHGCSNLHQCKRNLRISSMSRRPRCSHPARTC